VKGQPVYIEEVTPGARAIPNDPEWKYVTVRQLLIYIEHSIEQGI
jgi:phage tail sheath protein FI